jgi:hypothetical protein
MGNRKRVEVSQTHRILLSSPQAELHFGTPEVLVPACALLALKGVRLRPRPWVHFVHLLCQRHELLIAGSGLIAESLFLGARARDILCGPTSHFWQPGLRHSGTVRPALKLREALFLVAQDAMSSGGRSRIALSAPLRNPAASRGGRAWSGITSLSEREVPAAFLPNG